LLLGNVRILRQVGPADSVARERAAGRRLLAGTQG
jgi:hypothetical protein